MKNPKKRYKHLTQKERDRLEAMLQSGHKQKEIAQVLKVHKSTISREIKRNRRRKRVKGGVILGPYESNTAQQKVIWRQSNAKYRGNKISKSRDLKEYVIKGLEQYWSPDEISGRMKQEGQPFYASKTAIYEWLYNTLEGWLCCQYLYSQRHRPRKRRPKPKKLIIPNRISIWQRPKEFEQEYGHYEGDTVVSGKIHHSKKSLAVAYERKTKQIGIRKIPCLKPKKFNEAIISIKEAVAVKSMTFDNGIENRYHGQLGFQTFFCDPYSSWQKGGVENAIKMIRRFVPKGTDIGNYSKEYIKMVEDILNNKPRKSLDYKKPYEIMVENNLFVKNKTPEVALRG